MNTLAMDEVMRQRLLKTVSFSGRAHLRLSVSARRVHWGWRRKSAACAKRLLDLAGSLLLIILFSPLMLLIGLCLKLEDGGPVLFTQKRVGKFGRLFKMYKFRSMCLNAEQRLTEVLGKNHHAEGVTFKIKNDPRITRVGCWLRKLSLDELPQLFNVFSGEMSLVGPRPPLPREVARYSLEYRRRLNVAPGITCFWQVGGRADIAFPEQVKLDVLYIERQSFWLDISLLFKTVPAVVFRKGAY